MHSYNADEMFGKQDELNNRYYSLKDQIEVFHEK